MDLSERIRSMTDDELERVTARLEAEGGGWHDEPEREALVLLLRNERERREGASTPDGVRGPTCTG